MSRVSSSFVGAVMDTTESKRAEKKKLRRQ